MIHNIVEVMERNKKLIIVGIAIIAIVAYTIPVETMFASASGGGHHHHHHHKHRHHQHASASISQENRQRAVCISGSDTSSSCNQYASNENSGNAVSANVH